MPQHVALTAELLHIKTVLDRYLFVLRGGRGGLSAQRHPKQEPHIFNSGDGSSIQSASRNSQSPRF